MRNLRTDARQQQAGPARFGLGTAAAGRSRAAHRTSSGRLARTEEACRRAMPRLVPLRTRDPDAPLLTDASIRRLTWREAARALQIAVVVVRCFFPDVLLRRNRTAEALAPRIRTAVEQLGPPFVKLSQVIASSPGLFPTVISDELRVLLDAAPVVPWDEVRTTVQQSLGRPVEELFASVEQEPLASASIAQVHGAVLHDGRSVVIKVRRPAVEQQFLTDLRLLRVIARIAARTWRAARVFNPVAIVDDTAASLRQEFDFRREADAMERFGANLRAFGDNERIRVPAAERGLTTSAVLTMERVDGIKVDDLLKLQLTGLDLLGLLRAGVRAWIEGACEHGFFHGDVHAGNLLLDNEGRVVFLDFGIMGELDDTTRQLVRRGVVALLHEKDFEEVTHCLIALGAHLGSDVEPARMAAAIRRQAEPLLSRPLSELDYQAVLGDAVRAAAPHGVQMPRSLVLLFKQIIYFERYAKLVAPDWDILSDMSLLDFMFPPERRQDTA